MIRAGAARLVGVIRLTAASASVLRVPKAYRPRCIRRTNTYAMPNSRAFSLNAPGTAIATISIPVIAASIAIRVAPSSGSIALVSHAYAAQLHQRAASTIRPRARPSQVGSSAIIAVTWVIASTNTRSKNSSSGVTPWPPSSIGRIVPIRCVLWPDRPIKGVG